MMGPKIGIIGVNHVGAHVASTILAKGLAAELHFCDVNTDLCAGQVNDLLDAMPFYPHSAQIIGHDDRYEELAGCDILVNAAGHVRAAAESRDGELFITTAEVKKFAPRITAAGFSGIWVTVSNPNDVVAHAICHLTGYPATKVIGTGTTLDSARLCHALSKATGIDPRSITAYMLGEHGFSQFALWSHVRFGALSLAEVQDQLSLQLDLAKLEEQACYGGYITYKAKQCTEYAIANGTVAIIEAVVHNTKLITPVSTLLSDVYGESGIFASLPCLIGANGIEQVFVPEFSAQELEKWHASCAHIRHNQEQLPWW